MNRKKKGLTLVELVVVIALVTIVGGMMMTLFLSQNKSMTYVHDSTALQDEARTIISALENDIRIAKDRQYPIDIVLDKYIIYSYKTNLGEEFAYFYDKNNKSVIKSKKVASGYQEEINISNSVTSIIIDSPTRTGTDKVCRIILKMEKGNEQLEFETTVSERN